jgi:hypothetical protein
VVHIRPVLWPACRSATPPIAIHPSPLARSYQQQLFHIHLLIRIQFAHQLQSHQRSDSTRNPLIPTIHRKTYLGLQCQQHTRIYQHHTNIDLKEQPVRQYVSKTTSWECLSKEKGMLYDVFANINRIRLF